MQHNLKERLQEQQNKKRNYDVRTKQLSELQEGEVVRVKEGKKWRQCLTMGDHSKEGYINKI